MTKPIEEQLREIVATCKAKTTPNKYIRENPEYYWNDIDSAVAKILSLMLPKQKVVEALKPELKLNSQDRENARNSKQQRLLDTIKRDDLRAEIRKELGLEQ